MQYDPIQGQGHVLEKRSLWAYITVRPQIRCNPSSSILWLPQVSSIYTVPVIIIRLEARLQSNIGFNVRRVWRCSRVRLCLRRKWNDLDEIWSTLSTLSGAGSGRIWARSSQ